MSADLFQHQQRFVVNSGHNDSGAFGWFDLYLAEIQIDYNRGCCPALIMKIPGPGDGEAADVGDSV
jgi:hypothetical protein